MWAGVPGVTPLKPLSSPHIKVGGKEARALTEDSRGCEDQLQPAPALTSSMRWIALVHSLLRTVRTHRFIVLQETASYQRLRRDSGLGLHCSLLMKHFPEESPGLGAILASPAIDEP